MSALILKHKQELAVARGEPRAARAQAPTPDYSPNYTDHLADSAPRHAPQPFSALTPAAANIAAAAYPSAVATEDDTGGSVAVSGRPVPKGATVLAASKVRIWPIRDIAITNMIACMTFQRGVGASYIAQ